MVIPKITSIILKSNLETLSVNCSTGSITVSMASFEHANRIKKSNVTNFLIWNDLWLEDPM